MVLMVVNDIRFEMCHAISFYAKAINIQMKDYEESSCLMYLDLDK